MAHVPGGGQVFFRLGVVFFEELDDADVVLEGDDVGSGKAVEGWHVRSGSRQGAQDVLGETDGVEFEVGFEEEVGDVVEAPFPRFF